MTYFVDILEVLNWNDWLWKDTEKTTPQPTQRREAKNPGHCTINPSPRNGEPSIHRQS